jgi:hypothetical protein
LKDGSLYVEVGLKVTESDSFIRVRNLDREGRKYLCWFFPLQTRLLPTETIIFWTASSIKNKCPSTLAGAENESHNPRSKNRAVRVSSI